MPMAVVVTAHCMYITIMLQHIVTITAFTSKLCNFYRGSISHWAPYFLVNINCRFRSYSVLPNSYYMQNNGMQASSISKVAAV